METRPAYFKEPKVFEHGVQRIVMGTVHTQPLVERALHGLCRQDLAHAVEIPGVRGLVGVRGADVDLQRSASLELLQKFLLLPLLCLNIAVAGKYLDAGRYRHKWRRRRYK